MTFSFVTWIGRSLHKLYILHTCHIHMMYVQYTCYARIVLVFNNDMHSVRIAYVSACCQSSVYGLQLRKYESSHWQSSPCAKVKTAPCKGAVKRENFNQYHFNTCRYTVQSQKRANECLFCANSKYFIKTRNILRQNRKKVCALSWNTAASKGCQDLWRIALAHV